MKKLLIVSSLLATGAGVILVAGGIWGLSFTYKNIAEERIVTPADASIPNTPVLGPLTLKAQVDVIRAHTLESTDGKTFAEMPRQIPQTDVNGQPVVNANGEPVMEPNTARDIWITATTLTTALNLGIFAYVITSLIILIGCISIWTGIVFFALSRRRALA